MTELARDSVVEIRTILASGTGWIYRVDGNGKAWILTNEHVIRGARTVTVRLSGSGGTRTGTIVGQDGIRDLAVLTICCNRSWEALPTFSATALRAGSDVVALGFPSLRVGTELSVTTGVVSSYGFHDESRSWIIQTDAALNPGNSGGPLLNGQGQVIGVVSSRIDPILGENIGFAISMRTVELELDYLERGRTVLASPTPRPTRIPTRTPTRVPTAVPSTGTSGVLVHTADDFLACHFDHHVLGFSSAGDVLKEYDADIIAGVSFSVPNVSKWSIGFVFHDSGFGNLTSMYIYRSVNYFGAAILVWANNAIIDSKYILLDQGQLKSRPGQENLLGFFTNRNRMGFYLGYDILFDELDVTLVPRNGRSQVCVGMNTSENMDYLIAYSGLIAE